MWAADWSYRQSERLDIYREHVAELVKKGHAYLCFCSAERLQEVRDAKMKAGEKPMYDQHCLGLSAGAIQDKLQSKTPHVVRLKTPGWNHHVCRCFARSYLIRSSGNR